MKKIIFSFIAGIIFATAGAVYADEGLQKVEAYLRPTLPITLDNKPITLESSPIMYDGSTYLKLRDVAGLTGLQVNWNDATQTVELGKGVAPLATTSTTTTTTQSDSNVINMLSPLDPTLTKEKKIEVLKSRMDVLINVIRGLKIGLAHSETDKQEVKDKMEVTLTDYESQLTNLQSQLDALQSQP